MFVVLIGPLIHSPANGRLERMHERGAQLQANNVDMRISADTFSLRKETSIENDYEASLAGIFPSVMKHGMHECGVGTGNSVAEIDRSGRGVQVAIELSYLEPAVCGSCLQFLLENL
jgi:hypothetical protein